MPPKTTEEEIITQLLLRTYDRCFVRGQVPPAVGSSIAHYDMFLKEELRTLLTTLRKESEEAVAEARRKAQIELVRQLGYYLEHDSQCILSQGEAGRPTKDGGYETKYAGKWYKSGTEPKCDCGLEQALTPPDLSERDPDYR